MINWMLAIAALCITQGKGRTVGTSMFFLLIISSIVSFFKYYSFQL